MRILFSTLLFLFITSTTPAEVVDRVLALVNNQIITHSDLLNFSKKVKQAGVLDELLLDESESDIKTNKTAQLNYLIREKIIESEIQRLHLSVTSARVDQEISQMAKKNGLSKSEMLKMIRSEGVLISDYQDMIKKRIERQSLIESELSSKINISEEELLAYYLQKNPKASARIHEYDLAHIFFNPKKGGAAAAKNRAEQVLQKLKNSESFEKLAEQYSEDGHFENNGHLGVFLASELTPEFQEAVGDLSIGGFSSIAQSKRGFHILKVVNKKTSPDPEFEKQKERIRAILFESSFKKSFKEWIAQKKEDAAIRINQ